MKLSLLTPQERDLVFACLQAAVDGPFFEDAEFHTLFGMCRDELRFVIAKCPHIEDADETARLAINNTFCNLLWYPHWDGQVLIDRIGASFAEIERVFHKWRGT